MGEEHLDLLPLPPRDVQASVVAMSRAISRAPSWIERRILRTGTLGQHCGFSEQAWQSNLLA